MSARLCYHESRIIGYKYLISSVFDKNFLCFITKNEYNEVTNGCHGPMILNVT